MTRCACVAVYRSQAREVQGSLVRGSGFGDRSGIQIWVNGKLLGRENSGTVVAAIEVPHGHISNEIETAKTMHTDLIIERHFDDDDELLKNVVFDPLLERASWKFRGQGNKEHRLLPSALRYSATFLQKSGKAKSNYHQIVREWAALKIFARYADQQGLAFPGIHDWFKEYQRIHQLVLLCANGMKSWPPTEIYLLLALAQHYGVPTRVLDWTRAPLIGLYFAAKYAASEEDPDKSQVTLYALNENIHRLYLHIATNYKELFESQDAWLKGIDIPYAGNLNITAQRGSFTCIVENKPEPESPVIQRHAEEIIGQLAQLVCTIDDDEVVSAICQEPLIVKYMLPGNDSAARLLRKLSTKFSITGASVFPGYSGAVEAFKERRLWDFEWSDSEANYDLLDIASLGVAPNER